MYKITEIRGVAPHEQAQPDSEAELAGVLAEAGARSNVCYLAGGLTKLDWGAAPERIDLLVSTASLSGCSDVDPENLTLSAAAGTSVAEARAQATAVGRVLPIDPSYPARATIGGVVAAGDQGPRTAGYGGLRDVVLGVRGVLADGSVVKFGGRTMKNVTGYDMTKLFVGSFGVLGVIAEVTFRLLPRYDSQAVVLLPLASLEQGKESVTRILSSYLQPLALEVISPDALPADFAADTAKLPRGRAGAPATSGALLAPGRPLLLAGFGGHQAAVNRSVREVIDANLEAIPRVLRDGAAEALYEDLAVTGVASGGARLGLRASVPLSRALDVVAAGRDHAAQTGLAFGYRAGVARGRVDLVFSPAERTGADDAGDGGDGDGGDGDSPANQAAFGGCLSHLRNRIAEMGGSLMVTGGAGLLPPGYDPWGDVGPSLALMKRVKDRFDPGRVLNPGRFVGGI